MPDHGKNSGRAQPQQKEAGSIQECKEIFFYNIKPSGDRERHEKCHSVFSIINADAAEYQQAPHSQHVPGGKGDSGGIAVQIQEGEEKHGYQNHSEVFEDKAEVFI